MWLQWTGFVCVGSTEQRSEVRSMHTTLLAWDIQLSLHDTCPSHPMPVSSLSHGQTAMGIWAIFATPTASAVKCELKHGLHRSTA